MAKYIWGVDSARKVSPNLFQSVMDNFGYPNYWGRYLTTIPNATEGLTKDEINFMKTKGIKLLPIYNNLSDATGYREGQVAATNAIFHARRLDIPQGTPIFANVDSLFQVDSAWIQAWVETLYPSGFLSGFCHNPTEGRFNEEFCEAVENNNQVKVQSLLWVAEPHTGVTSKRKAPPFNPKKTNCDSNIWAWKYGQDAEKYPVDSNLIDKRLFNKLPF